MEFTNAMKQFFSKKLLKRTEFSFINLPAFADIKLFLYYKNEAFN